MYYAEKIQDVINDSSENNFVFDETYKSQSTEAAPLEADNGNGWYDEKTNTLHFVTELKVLLLMRYDNRND